MRRTLISAMLMVTAVFAISCSSDNDEVTQESVNTTTITFAAGAPESESDTRTDIGYDENNKLIPVWTSQDKLIIYTPNNTQGYETETATFTTPNGSRAEFKLTGDAAEDVKNASEFFILYYNTSKMKARPTYNHSNNTLDNIWTCMGIGSNGIEANELDYYDDILISKVYKKDEINFNEQVKINLKRLTSFIRFKVKDQTGSFENKRIKHIALGTSSFYDFTHNFSYNVYTGEKSNCYMQGTISQDFLSGKGPIIGSDDCAYAACLPTRVQISKFTFTIILEDGTQIDKITEGKEINLEEGKIKNITINIDSTAIIRHSN